jgi:hypothetical protein
MTSLYPSKSRILKRRIRHRAAAVRVVRAWKREFRGRRRTPDALRALLTRLSVVYRKPLGGIEFSSVSFFGDSYNLHTQVITLNPSNLSIVTALHEFAHHLFGRSELQACRWSVWMFRRTFRRTYRRLDWRGHMLVRRHETRPPVRRSARREE